MNQSQFVDVVISTINSIFSSIFSSIDNTVYDGLDNLFFICSDILNNSFINKFLGADGNNTFVYLADAFLLAFFVFYIIRFYYFNFVDYRVERPIQFIFKLLVFSFAVNFSYFLIDQFLNIFYLFSSSIQEIGKSIVGCDITFSELVVRFNDILDFSSGQINLFSFDGIIKGFISIGLINLLLSYSLRYILIQVLVLFTPFAILCLIDTYTSWIFKAWFKVFVSLLLLQVVVPVVLLVVFCIDVSNKILLVGGIYCLTRVNLFIKESLGGLSVDVSNNLGGFVSFFRR